MGFFSLYKRVGVLNLPGRSNLFAHDLASHCYFTTLRIDSSIEIPFVKYDETSRRDIRILWSTLIVQRFLKDFYISPFLCISRAYNYPSKDNNPPLE